MCILQKVEVEQGLHPQILLLHFFVLDFVGEDDDHNSNENQDFRFYPPGLIL